MLIAILISLLTKTEGAVVIFMYYNLIPELLGGRGEEKIFLKYLGCVCMFPQVPLPHLGILYFDIDCVIVSINGKLKSFSARLESKLHLQTVI